MGVWRTTTKFGVVVKDYTPRTPHCLALSFGECVQIVEETANCEWFRGSIARRGQKGIFPANHIHIRQCTVDARGQIEVIEDPVAREVSDVLKEWGAIVKQMYQDGQHNEFLTWKAVMEDLIKWRQDLLSGTLPDDALAEIKSRVTVRIDKGNREMGLDLIPRKETGEHVDGSNATIVDLFRIHSKSVETGRHASAHGSIRRPSPVKRALPPPVEQSQLFFRHLACLCSIEEEKEVLFHVYDAELGRFISEPYIVRLSVKGLPHDTDKIDNMCCLFTELTTKALSPNTGQMEGKDFWIVCQLLRRGPMELGSKLRRPLFRRPVGCGVVSIRQFLSKPTDDKETEFLIPINKCSEEDFHQLHELIIRGQTGKYQPLPSSKGVKVSLRVMPGEYSEVRRKNPLMFKKGTVVARKLGFPEVIMPGDVRNDLYITLYSALFERGTKSAPRNIECTVSVCLNDGTKLMDCVIPGAQEVPVPDYTSCVYYHSNSPRWNETFKLDVPIDKFEQAHLKFYFKHCSKDKQDRQQVFCFTFLPLMENGSTVKDGEKQIPVFKWEDRVDSSGNGIPAYLSNPAALKSSEHEHLVVHTLACSTKLTQNPYLLNLLKWRSQPPERLEDILSHIKFVQPEEIVKFLTDIFDAVFSILDVHPNLAPLVFEHALVPTICILSDKKFHNFTPVLDAYIAAHFSGAIAHKYLVACLKEYLGKAADVSFGEKLRAAIKAIEYIMKFIVRSRILYNRNQAAASTLEEFKGELMSVFQAFNALMRLTEPAPVIGTQTTTLQHFFSIFGDLKEIFTLDELGRIAHDFLLSIQYPKSHSKLSQHKLNFMHALVMGPVFESTQGRQHVIPPVMSILATHLERHDEIDLACEVLADALHLLSLPTAGDTSSDVSQVVRHVLQPVLAESLNVSRGQPGFELLLVDLLTMFHLMNDNVPKSNSAAAALMGEQRAVRIEKKDFYKEYLVNFGDTSQLRKFLGDVFHVFTKLVEHSAFPKDWLVMGMLQNDVVLCTVQNLSSVLAESFLKGNSFDKDLWNMFFRLCISYLKQPTLQIEKFSEAKREKVLGKHEDKRELMAFQISEMWQLLGEHQGCFIPSLVGPFQEMALLPNQQVRKLAIPIFFDMIEQEVKTRGSFKDLEVHIIDKLDAHVTHGQGDMEYKELFRSILTDLCAQSKNQFVRDNVPASVESVTQLLSRLLHLRNVPAGDEHRDERANCIYNLMEFYRQTDRREMYIRYIYKLRDIHESARHFNEAAFVLKLHADLLEWSDDMLPADDMLPEHPFPAQSARERKAKIYCDVIDLFAQGQTWENAIPLCKELAVQYETELFDYAKLSSILKRMAQFYDNICSGQRQEPQYFRVCYYGQGFPPGVRNKEFVYSGLKNDHISVFCDHIQSQFPKAALMMKNTPATPEMINGQETFIMICKLTPVVGPHTDRFKGKHVSKAFTAFYDMNEVDCFEYVRPFRKGEKTDNEFETLWTEKCTLRTQAKMPWFLNRAVITDSERKEFSPIENAITSMLEKNNELKDIIQRHAEDRSMSINPLTMALNGVIDAAVMGGTDMYRKAFFTPEYLQKNPDHGPFVDELEQLISKQISILEAGLQIHGSACPQDLMPMQQKLEKQLKEMKSKNSGTPERKKSISTSILNKAPAAEASNAAALRRATSAHETVAALKVAAKPQSFSGSLPSRALRPAQAAAQAAVAAVAANAPDEPVPPPRSSSFMGGVRPGGVGRVTNPFGAKKVEEAQEEAAKTPFRSEPSAASALLSPPEPPVRRSTPSSPNVTRRSVTGATSAAAAAAAAAAVGGGSASPTPAASAAAVETPTETPRRPTMPSSATTPTGDGDSPPKPMPKPLPKPPSRSSISSPGASAPSTPTSAAATPETTAKPPRPSTSTKPKVGAKPAGGDPATPSRNPFSAAAPATPASGDAPPDEAAPARPPKTPGQAAAASPNPFKAPPPRPKSAKPVLGATGTPAKSANPFAAPPPADEPPARPPKGTKPTLPTPQQ